MVCVPHAPRAVSLPDGDGTNDAGEDTEDNVGDDIIDPSCMW